MELAPGQWAEVGALVSEVSAHLEHMERLAPPPEKVRYNRGLVVVKALSNVMSDPKVRDRYGFRAEFLCNGLARILQGGTGVEEGTAKLMEVLVAGLGNSLEEEPVSSGQSMNNMEVEEEKQPAEDENMKDNEWWVDYENEKIDYIAEQLDRSDGGNGTVSIVKWRGHACASKMVGLRSDAKKSFKQEIELLWAVKRHENVVDCLGGYWDDKNADVERGCILMELIERGLNLELLVRNDGDYLSLSQRLQILDGVAAAMAYCVRCSPVVVHGDLHPKNILIVEEIDGEEKTFVPKLSDFGLGMVIEDGEESVYIEDEKCEGRAGYISPEKYTNRRATKKLDVWGFGWMAYFLFTGKDPERTKDADETSISSKLQEVASKIPSQILHVIEGCLVKDASRRISFEEIRLRLRPLLVASKVRIPVPVPTSGIGNSRSSLPDTSGMFHVEQSSAPPFATSEVSLGSSPRVSFQSFYPPSVFSFESGEAETTITKDPRVIEGDQYLYGIGVEQDIQHAYLLYRKAARDGRAEAMQCIAKYFREFHPSDPHNLERSLEWTRRAAARGNLASMCRLGYAYETGEGMRDWTKPMWQEAVFWYEKAAQQGHITALTNLGRCYQRGDFVGKDLAKAAELFKSASEKELASFDDPAKMLKKPGSSKVSTSATVEYAMCLKEGRGVPRDLNAAVQLFRRAAENGSRRAMVQLRTCFSNGNGFLRVDLGDDMGTRRKSSLSTRLSHQPWKKEAKKRGGWRKSRKN